MAQITRPTVVVFDLDDTLYKEIDYVRSGIDYVLQLLENLDFGFDRIGQLKNDIDPRKGNFLDIICDNFNFSVDVKQSLLWAYRLHIPSITLNTESVLALQIATKRAQSVCVLTDGRSITQRLKLKALGLNRFPAFISEEYGYGKPDPLMFESVQKRWSGSRFVYVGDNPTKDFFAPNELGWTTIGLLDDGRNIRKLTNDKSASQMSPNYQPRQWISKLSDIDLFI
jgi:putative hydrolase of the HAD superfamily